MTGSEESKLARAYLRATKALDRLLEAAGGTGSSREALEAAYLCATKALEELEAKVQNISLQAYTALTVPPSHPAVSVPSVVTPRR